MAVVVEEVGARHLGAVPQRIQYRVAYVGVRPIAGLAGAEIRLGFDSQGIACRPRLPSGAGKAADHIHVVEFEVHLQGLQSGGGLVRAIETAAVGGEHHTQGTGAGVVRHTGGGSAVTAPIGPLRFFGWRGRIQIVLDLFFQGAAGTEGKCLDHRLEG